MHAATAVLAGRVGAAFEKDDRAIKKYRSCLVYFRGDLVVPGAVVRAV